MKRLLDIIREPVPLKKQRENQINFYKFFQAHDERRNTNLVQTFPELKEFWIQCRDLAFQWDEEQKRKSQNKN